jgi:hypothetical protein
MILPKQGLDDLGQPVEASITLVRSVLRLGWRGQNSTHPDAGPLEVMEETLAPMRLSDASRHLLFPASKEWRNSVLEGRRVPEFVSTKEQDGQRIVRMHQDGRSGRLLTRPASAKRHPSTALRRAAGNPAGRSPLSLPPLSKIEAIPDPKETLHELLRVATELPA